MTDGLCLQRLRCVYGRIYRLSAPAGRSKVFAIDVGYGQLAWKTANDPRVVVMERTNIRYVTPEDLGEKLDLSVIDVSFISLSLVLPVVKTLLKPMGQVLCLIKPQFEAGRDKVGKKGVVRDAAVHEEVLQNFISLAKSLGFTIRNLTFSPVKGSRRATSNFSRIFPCSRGRIPIRFPVIWLRRHTPH